MINEANEPSSACRLWRIYQVETSTPPSGTPTSSCLSANRSSALVARSLIVCSRLHREIQSKRGAFAQAFAAHPQRASQLLRRRRAAVQAKSMSVFLGGVTVCKEKMDIFRRDAESFVI